MSCKILYIVKIVFGICVCNPGNQNLEKKYNILSYLSNKAVRLKSLKHVPI